MFWTKMNVLLVVLVASGVVGAGTSWLAGGPGKGEPSNIARAAGAEPKPVPVEGKEKADPKDLEKRRQAVLDEQARQQRAELVSCIRKEDDLSEKITQERESLVALEEQLREEEADARENRLPSEVEIGIAKEVARLDAELFNVERISEANSPAIRRQMQVDEATKRLRTCKEKRQVVRKKSTERLIEIRRSIVRKEEAIRRWERSRDVVRDEMDRLRDAASDRVRQGEGATPKALLRRLDAIQRDMTELRRELRDLKGKPKE